MVTRFNAPLLRRRSIADQTVEVTFGVPNSQWTFVAGQYVSVTAHDLERLDVRQQCRDFSIASSPLQKSEISIAFREAPSPFKQALLSAPLGTLFGIEGPKGVFGLPATTDQPFVFVAGGIGITPFLSMLRFAVDTGLSCPITLYYCNHSDQSAAYLPELQRIGERLPSLKLHNAFGHISDTDIERMASGNSSDTQWYIAGPPAMVAHVQMVLRASHISDTMITIESFTGY